LIVAQVSRVRHVSNSVQRQQTKWVVFGFALGIGCFLLLIVLANTLPPSSLRTAPGVGGTPVLSILLLLIPLSIGMAILRSRLYDIDVIINRTLVYGTLTGALALVYFGTVVL